MSYHIYLVRTETRDKAAQQGSPPDFFERDENLEPFTRRMSKSLLGSDGHLEPAAGDGSLRRSSLPPCSSGSKSKLGSSGRRADVSLVEAADNRDEKSFDLQK